MARQQHKQLLRKPARVAAASQPSSVSPFCHVEAKWCFQLATCRMHEAGALCIADEVLALSGKKPFLKKKQIHDTRFACLGVGVGEPFH